MTNYFEQRLHQIEILLHAYRVEDSEEYKDEIQSLEEERSGILLHLKYNE